MANNYQEPSAPPSHQSFNVDQKPQQGQQYPPNQQPHPQQYPPNQQPYPQQYPPNQQPYPQNNLNQARENENLAISIIIMVCCFPFSLCCIPCLFPNACGDSPKVLCFPCSLCCIPCLFPNACGGSSQP